MDFASIWVILKAKSCWAAISEYIQNLNMKLNEYGISEYAKNPYPLDALVQGLWRVEREQVGLNQGIVLANPTVLIGGPEEVTV